MERLPEECISMVLSFTSPLEACRFTAVSNTVRGAAESELLWEKFLPCDYRDILLRSSSSSSSSSSVSPIFSSFTSKKNLFLQLSDQPLLIDGGAKTFSIDKFSNKKCYMLSARELSIAWGSDPLSWCWKPFYHNSRFKEVAELVMTSWLDIHGKISTRMLSPDTRYGVYLVIKLAERAYGLDWVPSEVSVEVGSYKSVGHTYLRRRQESSTVAGGITAARLDERVLHERKDGWEEIELGEFYNDHESDDHEIKEVNMRFREIKGIRLKGGIVVEGIEIRPKF